MFRADAMRAADAADAPRATPFWERIEIGAALFVMFWLTGAWVRLISGQGSDLPLDDEYLRRLWLPAYAVILALAALRVARLGSVAVGAAIAAPLVILAFVSAEWSILPDVTTRRAVALALTSLFGVYLAARFSWRGMIELIAAAFLIVAVGSAVAALLVPSFGVDHTVHVGAWKGLFWQKNALGGDMVRSAHVCACAAILVPRRRLFWIGGAVLSAALVIGSTSTTALLGLVLSAGALGAIAALRTRGAFAVAAAWLALVGVAGVATAAAFAPDVVFGLFGKDATLTGRTEIWAVVMQRIEERPLLGYGFGAFWADDAYGPSAVIAQQLDWNVPSAHNGWLETMLQFGWVGLIVFAAHFALTTATAFGRLWSGPEAYWTVISLLLLLLFSVSESSIIQQNSVFWTLYLATAVKLLQVPVRSRVREGLRPPLAVEETRLA